jgi:hypothetical protein
MHCYERCQLSAACPFYLPARLPGTCALEVELLNAHVIGFCVTLADARWIAGLGVNALVSAEAGLPKAGAIYHATAEWLKAAGKLS